MAPKRNLGTRHTCPSCGTRYYDLHRPEPRCPKCGEPAADTSGLERLLSAVANSKSRTSSQLMAVSSEPEDDASDTEDPYGLEDDEYPLNIDKELDGEFAYDQES